MNAVDTNIFIYASDTNDPVKQAKAQALLGRLVGLASMTLIPWQVAGEYLYWLRKWESAGQSSPGDVETRFQAVLAMFPLAMPTSRSLPIYFHMRARYSLSHWARCCWPPVRTPRSRRSIPKTCRRARITMVSSL